MPWATHHVSAKLSGQSSSSGVSIQSRISPNKLRCSRWNKPNARSESGGLSGDFFKAVAQAANSCNAHGAFFNLFAQAVYVHLYGVVADLFAPFAQAFYQLVFADQATGAL